MCNREKRLHFIVIKYDCSDMTKDNIKQEEAGWDFFFKLQEDSIYERRLFAYVYFSDLSYS